METRGQLSIILYIESSSRLKKDETSVLVCTVAPLALCCLLLSCPLCSPLLESLCLFYGFLLDLLWSSDYCFWTACLTLFVGYFYPLLINSKNIICSDLVSAFWVCLCIHLAKHDTNWHLLAQSEELRIKHWSQYYNQTAWHVSPMWRTQRHNTKNLHCSADLGNCVIAVAKTKWWPRKEWRKLFDRKPNRHAHMRWIVISRLHYILFSLHWNVGPEMWQLPAGHFPSLNFVVADSWLTKCSKWIPPPARVPLSFSVSLLHAPFSHRSLSQLFKFYEIKWGE